jgi:hypothetical protein
MGSLLILAFEVFSIDANTIAVISDYSCYLGGIVLACMILKRRMAFRNAKIKIAPPLRWSKFDD